MKAHPIRLVHFLALAVIVLRFVPREWGTWQAPVFRHAILCGQHSPEIFCTGVFLSFGAHVILYECTAFLPRLWSADQASC
jgi:hypothetical protein